MPKFRAKFAGSEAKPTIKVAKTDAIKHKHKTPIVDRVKANMKVRVAQSRSAFDDIKLRLKSTKKHQKLSKKAQLERKKVVREQQKRGIIGIGLLFVIVSIAYSSYVIYTGVHSTASRVMLVPQVVFALLTLIKAFSKIYK